MERSILNFSKGVALVIVLAVAVNAQTGSQVSKGERVLSGEIVTQQNELLPGVSVIVRSDQGDIRTLSDLEGRFRLMVPAGPLTVSFEGKNGTPIEQTIAPNASTENLRIKVNVIIPPIQESVVIQDSTV